MNDVTSNSAPKKHGTRRIPKPKFGKESIKIIVVLSLIAFLSATLLGVVYMFTQVDEAKRLREKIGESYESPITDTIFDLSGYQNRQNSEILNVFRAEDDAILIHSKSLKAYSPSGIELVVIIKNGVIVKLISYKSAETPGLGSKALEESYLNNYIGFIVKNYDLSKEDGIKDINVDIVTGATRSSNAVKYAVDGAIGVYMYLLNSGALS